MDNTILQTILDFFHVMATILWIGGMIVNNLVIRPALQKALQPEQVNEIMGIIMSKFRIIVYVSIIVLFVTGIPMKIVSENYVGIIDFSSIWGIVSFVKHVFVAFLALFAFYSFEIMPKKLRKAMVLDSKDQFLKLQNVQKILGKFAFLFGLIIIMLSALMKYL